MTEKRAVKVELAVGDGMNDAAAGGVIGCIVAAWTVTSEGKGGETPSFVPVALGPLDGSKTMRVPPYHSHDASDQEVHHIYGSCLVGQRIPFPRRRSGTNGYPLCSECAYMTLHEERPAP